MSDSIREAFVREAMLQRANEVDDVCAGFLTNGVDRSRLKLRHRPRDLSVTEVLVDGVVRAVIKQTIEMEGTKIVAKTEVTRFD